MSFKTSIIAAAAFGLMGVPMMTAFPAVPLAATFSEEAPFDQAGFDAAQKADKPILVHITAPWCTTCAAQKPILDKLHAEARFKPIMVFNIDFDTQKALVHKFGATMQSTLIVYKGATEEGRSSGETRPAAIEALLAKSV